MLAGVAMALLRWPIVGRRSELEVFERALGLGERVGLVIHGRAGVGKTVVEAAGLAADRAVTCGPGDPLFAGLPIRPSSS
jgi:hypothetical protein